MTKQCQNCKFSYTDDDLQGHGEASARFYPRGAMPNHECRFNPPASSDGFVTVLNVWWCGRWEKK